MTTSKTLTATIAAAAMVGVIGLAYAQTSNDGTVQPGQVQDANRAAAMGTNSDTNLGRTPSTNTRGMPANTPMGSDSSTVSPGTTMANPSTDTNANRNSRMGSTNANGDLNTTMDERAARTDRN